ncbi:MAG: putative amidoligase domain-containing protein [Candidatus Thorarchaeota archaeon]
MLKIGADPELFLKKDGEFHSSHGIVPGTKREPHRVPIGAVQVDGMALEFNIDPAENSEEFVHNINTVLSSLREMVPNEYDFSLESIAMFPKEHMEVQPEEALLLGCEPDFNAYTGEENPAPVPLDYIRTAAGHVHLGWTEGRDVEDPAYIQNCCSLVKQLDYTLGLPSLVEDRDEVRRNMYGKAGAFRPKEYGLEYRVMSNYWLKSNETMRKVFNRAYRGFDWLKGGGYICSQHHPSAEEIINTHNVEAAYGICVEMGVL